MFAKKNQNITKTAQNFLKAKLDINVESNPKIVISEKEVEQIKKKYNISGDEKNILLGIGGSGITKKIPAKTFLKFMEFCNQKYKF